MLFHICYQPALFSPSQYCIQDEKQEPRRDSGDQRGVKGEEDVRHRRVSDRERDERDERRERVQRADEETGRNQRRETSKKSESEKSQRHEVGVHFDGLSAVRRRMITSTIHLHNYISNTIKIAIKKQ